MNSSIETAWLPELIFVEGRLRSNEALLSDGSGNVIEVTTPPETSQVTRLKNRALFPGLVNGHSHAFQRVIRGRTEYRSGNSTDSFWTWREMMYHAATLLSPDDIYDASRMAFLEMALSGITAVGEFHYLHNGPDGTPYPDPNLMAKQVIGAARDVGLRIALLRVAYGRSGFETPPDPRQLRFIEEPKTYLENVQALTAEVTDKNFVWTGVAPHSVRAVPLDYFKEIVEFANQRKMPVHMHVAEQPAEITSCIAEYGRSPIALLETEGLLSNRFTAVHTIHITEKAARALGKAQAMVCACPTTERNLGDGVVPASILIAEGVRISLGTDSQIQIDLLEDARELEYHLRLKQLERVVMADDDGSKSSLASRLFTCSTINGAISIGSNSGALADGTPADFFTVDLNDTSIAGASAEDLLANVVFSLSRTAVRDVVVGGKMIVEDGRHSDQDEILERFRRLQVKLWR